jgi:hypothetical protein
MNIIYIKLALFKHEYIQTMTIQIKLHCNLINILIIFIN